MNQYDLGHATIQPEKPVVAGSFVTIHYTYTCGHPIDDSGFIKITFRSVSDVGAPQFEDPTASNYCSVSTTGDCRIEPRWDSRGHIRPWTRALFLKVCGGFLNQGEKIKVIFGDRKENAPGWQMQTNCVEQFEFKTFVDPIATYQFKELPISPALKLIPGKPVRAVCIAPSQVTVNQEFSYYLKLEDRWGNPTERPHKITHLGFDDVGVETISLKESSTGLETISNPINVLAKRSNIGLFWADFHGQSGETVGDGTIDGYFGFARDFGLLDIAAHSGNDFQVSDVFWKQINQITHHYHQPGTFITFPGYEWSGNTPLGGDRNVYFESEGGTITRSSMELLPGNHSLHKDAPTASDLFVNLSEQSNPKSFVFAHVGGRYADLEMHDPEIELAVEIHSAWGTFEWLLADALKRGYRIGICANSDGHKGRPGASYPGASKFGSYGGLTCVLAPTLNRENIIQALRARHFYATTGNRPLLDLNINIDGKHFIMGDIVNVGTEIPNIRVKISGTAPIDNIEIRNGENVIKRLRPYSEADLGQRIKIVWGGAQVRGRDRLVKWDGNLEVQGNSILTATPINFWNANNPLDQIDASHLAWNSVTTGGTAGIILALANAECGTLHISTMQGNIEMDIDSIGLEPIIRDFGALRKEIRIYRLPDYQATTEFSFELPLTGLQEGDNPIYIRVCQEDEHMAWTSPAYLVL